MPYMDPMGSVSQVFLHIFTIKGFFHGEDCICNFGIRNLFFCLPGWLYRLLQTLLLEEGGVDIHDHLGIPTYTPWHATYCCLVAQGKKELLSGIWAWDRGNNRLSAVWRTDWCKVWWVLPNAIYRYTLGIFLLVVGFLVLSWGFLGL